MYKPEIPCPYLINFEKVEDDELKHRMLIASTMNDCDKKSFFLPRFLLSHSIASCPTLWHLSHLELGHFGQSLLKCPGSQLNQQFSTTVHKRFEIYHTHTHNKAYMSRQCINKNAVNITVAKGKLTRN